VNLKKKKERADFARRHTGLKWMEHKEKMSWERIVKEKAQ
jgi:hypothetical protein